MKRCCTCGEVKELADFHKRVAAKDGKASLCKKCVVKRFLAWQKANPDKARVIGNRYRANHPERIKQTARASRLRHPGAANARARLRTIRKLRAAPQWLTPQQKAEIKECYTKAKWLERHHGGKWHVDHIIPLKGKNVSGLHVPWNLQVISAEQNLRKSNKV